MRSVQAVLFSEYILSLEFDMGYLSLEDIYADDVKKNMAIYGWE